MSKLRILVLHGYTQNAERFRKRLGSLRKGVAAVAEMSFLDAPVDITPPDSEDAQLSWWSVHEEPDTEKPGEVVRIYDNWDTTVDHISNYCKTEGPFDGIFGFSQGAVCASLVCGLQQLDKQRESRVHPEFDFRYIRVVTAACLGRR
eukprot:GFYU01036071.1.p1 GENE.GFYU01036071.1~~GFYU01036071.1.p1  ORF type:complete len:147 (+),score=15.22 GFYU01036071.1:176-616(+)